MLHLKIVFKSSWTNSFADEEGAPRFTSGAEFNGGQRNLTAVPLATDAPPNQSRVHNVRRLNAANPDMCYRVPSSYGGAVKGILARLMGEVDRVRNLPSNHPVHRVFAHSRYDIEITSEHDEVISFATCKRNEIQSSGAGLLPGGNPLYEKSALAKTLFGHLGSTLAELVAGTAPVAPWLPTSPSELIGKLVEFKEAQTTWVKALKVANSDTYVSPFDAQAQTIRQQLAALPQPVNLKESPDDWNWAGAFIALRIHLLDDADKSALVAAGVLSKNGGLSGLAMSGGIGNVTPKDLYEGAGCQKAYSNRMPYGAELWFGEEGSKPRKVSMGVIKKDGSVSIEIDLPYEEALALKSRIEDAAVGPFHFGKKGIAYISRMYVG